MHFRQGQKTKDAAYQEHHYLVGFQILQSSSVKPMVEEPFRRGPADPRGPRLPDWWKHYPVSQGLGEECELPKSVPPCLTMVLSCPPHWLRKGASFL